MRFLRSSLPLLAACFFLPGFDAAANDSLLAKLPELAESDIEVQIDGRLDEPVWEDVPWFSEYTVSSPDRGEVPPWRTHTRIFYTERGLYIGSWNEQPAETLLPRLTARDDFTLRDGFQVVLDTSGEGRYGYWFEVGLGGSLLDGIILPERQFQRDWDGPWHGASAATADGWSVEMLLPWSMLNMPQSDDEKRTLGIYLNRRLGKLDERWSYPYLPQTQPRFISAFKKFWVRDIAPRQQYSLYPYASYTLDGVRHGSEPRAGMDVFWRPSSSLRLSATLKPDFGQVEADDVDVNFSAFETFFPERRMFFLENQDVFTTTPRETRDGTLLNTRRIGASIASRRGRPDFPDEGRLDPFARNQPVELLGALKTTGEVGVIRYGFLGAVEQDTDPPLVEGASINAPGRDFGIMRIVHEDTKRGDRRAIGWMGTVAVHPDRRAITQGVDGHFRSRDGSFTFDGQLFHSDVDGVTGSGLFADFKLAPSRGHTHELRIDWFDDQIDLNDLGYLRRNDLTAIRYDYRIREDRIAGLNSRQSFLFARANFNSDEQLTGGGLFVRRRWEYMDNSRLRLGVDFIAPSWDDRNSRGNGDYKTEERWGASAEWNSDFSAPLVYVFKADLQEEGQGGLRHDYTARVIFRPVDSFSAQLRARYRQRDAWLIWQGGRAFKSFETEEWRPRFSLNAFLSARQQLRLAVEWVGVKASEAASWLVPAGDGPLRQVQTRGDAFAISDLTVQARYRYEIAPLSTLFVVYSRGGRLPRASPRDSFGTLFSNAFSQPEVETLIVKLRYRFGPS